MGVPCARAVLRAVRPARRKARPTTAAKVSACLLRIVFFIVFSPPAGVLPRRYHILPTRRPMGGRPFETEMNDTGVLEKVLPRKRRFACPVRAGNNDTTGMVDGRTFHFPFAA